ncbi:MAG TPA: hypothetical protein PLC53_03745, partial [Bacilli bacterium]|nr:hypothetical protein [Bacilli bacterium]
IGKLGRRLVKLAWSIGKILVVRYIVWWSSGNSCWWWCWFTIGRIRIGKNKIVWRRLVGIIYWY